MELNGSNANWQVEGIMNKQNTSLMIGFQIADSTGKNVRFQQQHRGFARVINGNWLANNRTAFTSDAQETFGIFAHNGGKNAYSFGNALKNYTGGDIRFKAVLYDDVLSVWFDGEL